MPTPPVVNGISPCQGPPGIKVTLHGEGLGTSENDVEIVMIGRYNCTYSLEWISSKRLKVRVGPESGRQTITIKTRSGGLGSAVVEFRCLNVSVGPLEESAVWVEEQPFVSSSQRKQSYTQPESDSSDKAYGFELTNILGLVDDGCTGISEDELASIFPDKSGNLLSDDFDPIWYLLEHYQSASLEDIKRGLQHLKEAQGESTTGSVSFRKQHIQLYLESHNLMHVLLDMIKKDNIESGGVFDTKPMDEALTKSISYANNLFDDVLRRKEDADAQRLSLELINRNEFLFSLPSTIEGAMKRNEFDLIISYYRRRRVEPLLAKSESRIFKELNNKIDSVLEKVRDTLKEKLHTLPSTFEEQRRLIRYLTDLDTQGDVAWELIQQYKRFFDVEMVSLKAKYLQSTNRSIENKSPDKVSYVIELKSLFTKTFSSFWKLGQSYFTGNLLLNETGRSAPADVSRFSEFKEIVVEVVKLYCNLIRAVFTPRSFENFSTSEKERFGIWSSDFEVPTFISCVYHVRTSVLFLHRLPDPLPARAIDLIDALSVDIRRECLRTTFEQTISFARKLNERESWLLEVNDVDGTMTELPKLFEQLVTDSVHQLSEVSSRLPTADADQDADIFRDYLIAKEAKSWLIQLFQAFAAAIEAASSTTAPRASKDSAYEVLLICANNSHITAVHVLPRIIDVLQRRGYQLLNDIKKAAVDVFDTLANRLLGEFLEKRLSHDVVGHIEQRMYAASDFSWTITVPPSSPSPYIIQTLLDSSSFRFNIMRLAPFGLKTAMIRLSVEISEEIIRLFRCIVESNAQAIIQQRVDLNALMIVLQKWMPDQTKRNLTAYLNSIRIPVEQAGRVDILVKRFNLQHALLLSSFT